MTDAVIHVENLGKRYELGELVNAGRALRAAGRALGFGRNDADDQTELWALRHVSFEVKRGEVLGVIGRNGAGKSTLLKILSRVTRPTEGHAELRGRVGSLLEVGTGFHPELTGRDNIYLNGAILGMSKAEIDRRMDEIIDFSGVEKFLDTPVKRYSSGMYTRLAFAVAAHLTTEVLICDEVLAVGDSAFQRKCIGKMQQVAHDGRTILFVSHRLDSVQALCQHCLFLDAGEARAFGPTDTIISQYLSSQRGASSSWYKAPPSQSGHDNTDAFLEEAYLARADGSKADTIRFREPFAIHMTWITRRQIPGLAYVTRVFDSSERLLFASNTLACNPNLVETVGHTRLRCSIPENVLVPGTYRVELSAWLRPHTRLYCVEQCLTFDVLEVAYDTTQPFNVTGNPIIAPPAIWDHH